MCYNFSLDMYNIYIYIETGRRPKHQAAFQCRLNRAPFSFEAKESLRERNVRMAHARAHVDLLKSTLVIFLFSKITKFLQVETLKARIPNGFIFMLIFAQGRRK